MSLFIVLRQKTAYDIRLSLVSSEMCMVDKYNTIGIGSVGIVKSQWGVLVNCAFGNTSGAFISEEIKHLEGSCK